MSLLKLFGGGAAQKKEAPSPQASIDKLRQTLELLEKRESYLETKITKEIQNAKANATKNKRSAIMSLKRKKAYEAQIANLSGARLTIETQIMAIESATTHFAALSAMQEGARAMKSLNNNMAVEDVDEVMDEIREQIEVANEVGQAISSPLGMEDVDEGELEDELERLVEEDLNTQFKDVSVPTATPAAKAPAQAAKAKPSTEEDEFAALGAEMGM